MKKFYGYGKLQIESISIYVVVGTWQSTRYRKLVRE